MNPKSCSKCMGPAAFSLCLVLSTVNNSPRKQKCSPAVLFCDKCIRGLRQALCIINPDALREAVNTAYTALTAHSEASRVRDGEE
jgi:hypothetical protein